VRRPGKGSENDMRDASLSLCHTKPFEEKGEHLEVFGSSFRFPEGTGK
jgi:hypothetical protein